jgi:hypothetical protein
MKNIGFWVLMFGLACGILFCLDGLFTELDKQPAGSKPNSKITLLEFGFFFLWAAGMKIADKRFNITFPPDKTKEKTND